MDGPSYIKCRHSSGVYLYDIWHKVHISKNQSLQNAVFDICVRKQCRQKLDIILWSYVNCEKFFSDKEIRKIRIFFDIDNWLWSPNFMIFNVKTKLVPNVVNISNNSLFSLVNLSLSSQNLYKSKQVSWLYENKETFKQE